MILSTQTHVAAERFGDAEAVRVIAAAGFDAIDFSMFEDYNAQYLFSDGYKEYIAQVKAAADECGVYFNQAHAPFPSYRVGDDEYNEMIFPRLIRAIEIAGLLGVKNIIIHPVFVPENKKEFNMNMYNSLLPYAKQAGVKIALENMWGRDKKRGYIVHNVCSGPDELADYHDSLPREHFTVCLDIGHCGLVGEDEAEFIERLGAERLTCLHVHDTNYKSDDHTVPFIRSLDWEKICAALAKIGYKGDLTFEADAFMYNIPSALIPSALKFMHDTGRYLISLIERKD